MLGTAFLVVGLLFHCFKCIMPLPSGLQVLLKSQVIILWLFSCTLLVSILLLLLIFLYLSLVFVDIDIESHIVVSNSL